MKYCSHCDKVYDDAMNFCTECGGRLIHKEEENREDRGMPVKPELRPKKKGSVIKRIVVSLVLVGIVLVGIYNYLTNAATYLRLEPNELIASKQGGEIEIAVDYDGFVWWVNHQPEWVEIEETEEGMKMKVEPNRTGHDRRGSITVQSGKLLAQIIVAQRGRATFLRVSQRSVHSGAAGETVEVKVKSDGGDWRAECPEGIKGEKVDRHTLRLTFAENKGYSKSGYVVVREDRIRQIIAFRQGGICEFCKGMGKVRCPYCNGYDNGYGCMACGGSGQMFCSECQGTGRLE